jgi:hypothetical protein
MKQKQWLTLKEIEEYWGYSGEFIKYLIATHRLPALRLRKPGTPIVIREDWWEKFCQAMDLMLELSTTAIALDNLPIKKDPRGRGIGLLYVEDLPKDEKELDRLLEMQSLVATVELFTSTKDVDKVYQSIGR